MIGLRTSLPLAGLLALGACAVAAPSGPDVMALPAQGKDLATFQREDINCRGHAQQSVAPYLQPLENGTVATGGSATPAAAAAASGNLQQAYDIAYTQCMYASGNKVTSPPAGAVYAEAEPYGYYGPGYIAPPLIGFGFGYGGYYGFRGGYGGYRGGYDHDWHGGGRGGWRR